VPVDVFVPVLMGVRVAVYQIPVAVYVVVHVLVGMGMLVIVFVPVVGLRGVGVRVLGAVRVIVGEALSVRHWELRCAGEVWQSPIQRPQPSETRTWRGSTGWK
jgi:hypothetical protein